MSQARLFQRALKYAQRSPEWYQARHNILTSSEIASILDSNNYESAENMLLRKCKPLSLTNTTHLATEWGEKYEPIAKQIFKQLTNLDVTDIGLVVSEKYPFIGASPDGVVQDGRLIEIKCPYIRRINPTTYPFQYWIQMQIQLEVCDIDS